jgi:hypothetical protein
MPCPVAGSHGSYAELGHWSSYARMLSVLSLTVG